MVSLYHILFQTHFEKLFSSVIKAQQIMSGPEHFGSANFTSRMADKIS